MLHEAIKRIVCQYDLSFLGCQQVSSALSTSLQCIALIFKVEVRILNTRYFLYSYYIAGIEYIDINYKLSYLYYTIVGKTSSNVFGVHLNNNADAIYLFGVNGPRSDFISYREDAERYCLISQSIYNPVHMNWNKNKFLHSTNVRRIIDY